MFKRFSRVLTVLLALSFVISVTEVPVMATTADVVRVYATSSDTLVAVEGGQKVNLSFSAPGNYYVYLGIMMTKKVSFRVDLKREGSSGNIASVLVNSTDDGWQYNSHGLFYTGVSCGELPKDEYTACITFGGSTAGYAYVFGSNSYTGGSQQPSDHETAIAKKSTTVTVGFSKTLATVAEAKSYKSSNSSVVAVSSKGKITGKRTGKATITINLSNGNKVIYTVTVKANKFSDQKYSVHDVSYGMVVMQPYSASYDTNGNLILKVEIVNNSDYTIYGLRNLTVEVLGADSNIIGIFRTSNKSLKVQPFSTKNVTFKINKSSVKKKHADLRLASITSVGNYQYYQY